MIHFIFLAYVKALFATESETISPRLTSSSKHFPNVILPERSGIFHFTFPAYVKVNPRSFKLETWHSHARKGMGHVI